MATVLSSNLYPPLIDTFMPAFLEEGPAQVTFSISPYNSSSEINRLHVSLVDQQTGLNVLKNSYSISTNKEAIKSGIWILPLTSSNLSVDSTTNLYTLSIPKTYLKSGDNFLIDRYYKLQLRFDKSDNNITDTYLTDTRAYFSEWSSVCLLRAIGTPTIELSTFQENYVPGNIPIAGRVTFDDDSLTGTKKETISYYSISIYNKSDPTEVLDSTGIIFTGDQADQNSFYWIADGQNASVGSTYVVKIYIVTKNQYEMTETFSFDVDDYSSISFTPTFTFVTNAFEKYNVTDDGKIITKEDGVVKFNISVKETLPSGYLYVRRASSLDNYKTWSLISCTKETSGTVNRDFEDMTVASLVRYKYSVQFQLKKGLWTRSYQSSEVIYPDFYDMLLSRDGRQLAIRYNGQITNLKPTVNRQKIDTLGGKYPKFAENAQLNYKVYSISGLIDAESDFNRYFFDETEYSDQMSDYNSQMNGKYQIRNDTIADGVLTYSSSIDTNIIASSTNTVHDIYPVDNWWLERQFREEAIEWLNDGEPKLFRSMTEGNIVVMLTDISLTPNATLGRRLYNFTATMYEIEDGYSLSTLNSLGIITIPNEKEEATGSSSSSTDDDDDDDKGYITRTGVGQFFSQYLYGGSTGQASVILGSMTGTDNWESLSYNYIYPSVEETLTKMIYDGGSSLGSLYAIVNNSIELKDVKIYFESKPRWYTFSGTSITLVEEDNIAVDSTTAATDKDLHLGYKIALTTKSDGKTVLVFVNEKGFYQVPHNLDITSLVFYDNPTATIDYILSYQIEYNESSLPSKISSSEDLIGQLSGIWRPNTSISKTIADKYYYTQYSNGTLLTEEKMNSWKGVSLEVTPYTVVAIKFDGTNETFSNFVVGRSGIYNLMHEYPMQELTFLGRRMVLAEDERQPYLDEWEYVLDDSAKLTKDATLYNLTWEEFIDRQITETETLVDINGQTTTQEEEGINRLWNNLDNSKVPTWQGYESVEDIVTPKYNTVYGIINGDSLKYMIYYIDEGWYEVSFLDAENQNIILAAVPVYGMVNYTVNTVKMTY